MQLRNIVRENIPHFEFEKLITEFVNYFSKESVSVSCTEKSGKRKSMQCCLIKCGGLLFPILTINKHQTYCRLIQLRVIHRSHYSKVMLHRFYPSVSPICDKCKLDDGRLLQLFWKCLLIYPFWSRCFFFFFVGLQ